MFGTTESLERINIIKESFMEEMILELRFEGEVKGVDSMGKVFKTKVSNKIDVST